MKRRTLCILGVAFGAAVLGMIAFALLLDSRYPTTFSLNTSVTPSQKLELTVPPQLAIVMEENHQLIDDDSVTLSGKTNYQSLTISVDNQKLDTIKVRNQTFSYQLELSKLSTGWHYISLDRLARGTQSPTEIGIWVHIIPGQPSVLVPRSIIQEARTINGGSKRSYRNDIIDNYAPSSNYFGFNKEHYVESETLKFDEQGIPLVLNNGTNWSHNPTTISQYAFALYNSIETDASNQELFLNVASWLAEHQEEDGSFPYDYEFAYKKDMVIPEGFVSGMGQGQLLSVYARAYLLTEDAKYLEAGEKCLEFMTRFYDSPESGTKVTLKDFTDQSALLKPYEDYVLYDEYLIKPETYVLNGNLFALIGLYDWWKSVPESAGASQAKDAFEQGCAAIEVLLPYYDYNGYSAYDLLPYTSDYPPYFTSSYAHSCHIYLLHTLAEITGNPTFQEYYTRFKSYSDNPFYKQTDQLLP